MKRDSKFIALLIFFGVGFLTLVAGIVLAFFVGEATGSGLLGICGPHGPGVDLMGAIVLGSIPLGFLAGLFAARYFYRRGTFENKD